jgi:hypothetical protein
MKFRLIQSNNRGLIVRVGDRTFSRRKPANGEENQELPTLFILRGESYVFNPKPHCFLKKREDGLIRFMPFETLLTKRPVASITMLITFSPYREAACITRTI